MVFMGGPRRERERNQPLKVRVQRVLANVPQVFGIVWQANRPLTLAVIGLTLVSGLVPAALIRITQILVDEVAGALRAGVAAPDALRAIAPLLGLYVGVNMGQHLMGHAQRLAQKALGDRVTFRLNQSILEKAQRLDYAIFENPTFYDQLQRAQREAGMRPLLLLRTVLGMGRSVVTIISMLGILFGAHWILPLVLVLAALPTGYISYRFGMEQFRLMSWFTPDGRRMNYLSGLLTGVNSVKEIRLFQIASHLMRQYSDLFQKVRREEMRLEVRRTGWTFGAEIVRVGTYVFAYGLLIWSLFEGSLSFGAFVAYAQAVLQVQGMLDGLFTQSGEVFEHSLFATDLFTFLNLPEEQSSRPAPGVALARLDGGIQAEGVTFVYPGTRTVALENVSFSIRPGEKIALVGENGAGKTTLVKLITGLYGPTRGKLTVGGVPVQDLDPESLRARVAVLFQDFVQYMLTARENVGFGNLAALHDDEQVRWAASQSGADAFLSRLPQGYESNLGRLWEGGQQLSIGQWQKVALARAFLRPADILILDEPTAALDPRAETELFNTFRQLADGKTSIFISHRIGTARLADRIFVLLGGRLVEQGTHEELLAQNCEYARLFRLQAQWYQ